MVVPPGEVSPAGALADLNELADEAVLPPPEAAGGVAGGHRVERQMHNKDRNDLRERTHCVTHTDDATHRNSKHISTNATACYGNGCVKTRTQTQITQTSMCPKSGSLSLNDDFWYESAVLFGNWRRNDHNEAGKEELSVQYIHSFGPQKMPWMLFCKDKSACVLNTSRITSQDMKHISQIFTHALLNTTHALGQKTHAFKIKRIHAGDCDLFVTHAFGSLGWVSKHFCTTILKRIVVK
ncbi:hypothetical protein EDD18DRAFT_1109462 [Armillaria luteobubalina]|uniref:Uncharacterized protein n=1 Tax=Armillaria luteobubalina TaxID=153913 RepID=A0AA39PX10_9AGAR|nr:hypothetical protein EDD18DRAFT_1109462 [Armillaria luteobubalina]